MCVHHTGDLSANIPKLMDNQQIHIVQLLSRAFKMQIKSCMNTAQKPEAFSCLTYIS